MAVYTRLRRGDLRAISKGYNLDLIDYEPIAGGAANSNYLIRTKQGLYVLTVFEEKNSKLTVELGRLLLFLAEQRFPAPRPLFSASGGLSVIHDGKPVMVKEYVQGKTHRDLSDAMLRQIGAEMARLHQIPLPDFLPSRLPYGAEKLPFIAGPNIDTEFLTWTTRYFDDYRRKKPQGLPRGVIHGDVFSDNVLFEDGELQAIIDFEEACCGETVFDLAMAVVGTCRVAGQVDLERARALVHGYERVRKLKELERRSLKTSVEYAAATVSCWRYWKYHIEEPDGAKADKHRQMVGLAEEIQKIPEDHFSQMTFQD